MYFLKIIRINLNLFELSTVIYYNKLYMIKKFKEIYTNKLSLKLLALFILFNNVEGSGKVESSKIKVINSQLSEIRKIGTNSKSKTVTKLVDTSDIERFDSQYKKTNESNISNIFSFKRAYEAKDGNESEIESNEFHTRKNEREDNFSREYEAGYEEENDSVEEHNQSDDELLETNRNLSEVYENLKNRIYDDMTSYLPAKPNEEQETINEQTVNKKLEIIIKNITENNTFFMSSSIELSLIYDILCEIEATELKTKNESIIKNMLKANQDKEKIELEIFKSIMNNLKPNFKDYKIDNNNSEITYISNIIKFCLNIINTESNISKRVDFNTKEKIINFLKKITTKNSFEHDEVSIHFKKENEKTLTNYINNLEIQTKKFDEFSKNFEKFKKEKQLQEETEKNEKDEKNKDKNLKVREAIETKIKELETNLENTKNYIKEIITKIEEKTLENNVFDIYVSEVKNNKDLYNLEDYFTFKYTNFFIDDIKKEEDNSQFAPNKDNIDFTNIEKKDLISLLLLKDKSVKKGLYIKIFKELLEKNEKNDFLDSLLKDLKINDEVKYHFNKKDLEKKDLKDFLKNENIEEIKEFLKISESEIEFYQNFINTFTGDKIYLLIQEKFNDNIEFCKDKTATIEQYNSKNKLFNEKKEKVENKIENIKKELESKNNIKSFLQYLFKISLDQKTYDILIEENDITLSVFFSKYEMSNSNFSQELNNYKRELNNYKRIYESIENQEIINSNSNDEIIKAFIENTDENLKTKLDLLKKENELNKKIQEIEIKFLKEEKKEINKENTKELKEANIKKLEEEKTELETKLEENNNSKEIYEKKITSKIEELQEGGVKFFEENTFKTIEEIALKKLKQDYLNDQIKEFVGARDDLTKQTYLLNILEKKKDIKVNIEEAKKLEIFNAINELKSFDLLTNAGEDNIDFLTKDDNKAQIKKLFEGKLTDIININKNILNTDINEFSENIKNKINELIKLSEDRYKEIKEFDEKEKEKENNNKKQEERDANLSKKIAIQKALYELKAKTLIDKINSDVFDFTKNFDAESFFSLQELENILIKNVNFEGTFDNLLIKDLNIFFQDIFFENCSLKKIKEFISVYKEDNKTGMEKIDNKIEEINNEIEEMNLIIGYNGKTLSLEGALFLEEENERDNLTTKYENLISLKNALIDISKIDREMTNDELLFEIYKGYNYDNDFFNFSNETIKNAINEGIIPENEQISMKKLIEKYQNNVTVTLNEFNLITEATDENKKLLVDAIFNSAIKKAEHFEKLSDIFIDFLPIEGLNNCLVRKTKFNPLSKLSEDNFNYFNLLSIFYNKNGLNLNFDKNITEEQNFRKFFGSIIQNIFIKYTECKDNKDIKNLKAFFQNQLNYMFSPLKDGKILDIYKDITFNKEKSFNIKSECYLAAMIGMSDEKTPTVEQIIEGVEDLFASDVNIDTFININKLIAENVFDNNTLIKAETFTDVSLFETVYEKLLEEKEKLKIVKEEKKEEEKGTIYKAINENKFLTCIVTVVVGFLGYKLFLEEDDIDTTKTTLIAAA